MKFKDRLDIYNEYNKPEYTENISTKEDKEVLCIFEKDEQAENIIKELTIAKKNIIILSPINYDKTILCNYIRLFINQNQPIEIIRNISDNLMFLTAETVIVPEPDTNDFVKILELILKGYKSFIFSLNIKNFFNVIESLETILLINNKNMDKSTVQHLIGSSESALIFISRNSDGLFFIQNIGQIKYDENGLLLENLYDKYEKDRNYSNNKDNSKPEKVSKKSETKKKKSEYNVLNKNLEIDSKKIIDDNNDSEKLNLPVIPVNLTFPKKINEITSKEELTKEKINKYKLLKLKIKNRNSSNVVN